MIAGYSYITPLYHAGDRVKLRGDKNAVYTIVSSCLWSVFIPQENKAIIKYIVSPVSDLDTLLRISETDLEPIE